jgi:NAD(P)-dependent dehydrogenase (short-subunit alcohol dehydrogenase family)
MRFAGKTAVVTGAASGIGKATALRLASEGATVIAADIDDEAGAELAATSNGKIHYKHCDVCSDGEIKALMDFAAEKTGGIDVLFNNAGAGGAHETIDEIDADGWDRTMDLLLRSVAMGIRHAVPHMKGRAGASIINTASVAALSTGMAPTAYSVAKGGVLHLTKLAAGDLAKHAIRVNAICPGLARGGKPEDIAGTVAFLASNDAAFITGTHILVDGGLLIGPRHSWDPESPGLFDAIRALAESN